MAQSESSEQKWIWLLCLLAAVHVFIFSAAFPLINNVDEQAHFDLVVKYSHGHPPRGMEPVSKESMQYVVIYGSQEFIWPPETFPDGKFPPPPWTQPLKKIAPILQAREAKWQSANHESPQQPLYYALAGFWWDAGKCLGFEGGRLLYWLRFLNILFVAALVWLGYATAKEIFPENFFLRIGLPALLAFMPQTAFYSINNDVLSPLCFGAAFLCLVKLMRTEIPVARLGIFTGLALAATFLTKIANLPLLVVAIAAVLLKILRLEKSGKLRAALPSLVSLFFCAVLPMAAWIAWTKYNFGDFTGTTAKIQFLGWTLKPFAEWWHHPIFTPHGFWIFIRDLLATFWRGEILWHRQPLASPTVDIIYVVLAFILAGFAVVNLLSKSKPDILSQREALWLGLACFIAAIAFSGFLSIIYDFHDCFYPSREHPYFTSGRLMLGALIPFLLIFVHGIDRALKKIGDTAKFLAFAAMILFMLISEIATDWPVFSSQYNWFHM
ncbi:MAG TPA: DUF2142 domain-containing protein [Dongiaceae bacterium]|jgi:hypothetical protein|nr:DUF2142 domain-containing protein [Dongiaceae bacterium]